MKTIWEIIKYAFWVLVIIFVINLIVSIFTGVKVVLSNVGSNFVPERVKYSETITHRVERIENVSSLDITTIPIYLDEECTNKVYLRDTYDLSTLTHYISISDNNSNYVHFGEMSYPVLGGLETYDYRNIDYRYSYFEYLGVLHKLDWGEHFELLIDLTNYFYWHCRNIDNVENLEEELITPNNYFNGRAMFAVPYGNFISYKNNNSWYQIRQLLTPNADILLGDKLIVNLNITKSYLPTTNIIGGENGGGGGGSW